MAENVLDKIIKRKSEKLVNLKKTISACVLAHKKTSSSLTVDQAKVLCEKEINNMVDNSK